MEVKKKNAKFALIKLKSNKLFWSLVSVFAVFALSSCEPKNPNGPDEPGVVVPGDEEEEEEEEEEPELLPEVEAPAADKTTFLFQIQGAACEDFSLYLMGIGGVWEDQESMKFERVPNTKSWFQLTIDALDVDCENFKIRANGDWAYEPKAGYNFLEGADNFVAGGADGGNINNLMVLAPTGGQVIALEVIEFATPCADALTYKVTLKTNFCGEGAPAIIGSIPNSGWGTVFEMAQIDDTTYEYNIEGGQAGQEFKFQSSLGGWVNEPKVLDEATGEWKGMDNYKLADETNIVIDLTAYTWSECIE